MSSINIDESKKAAIAIRTARTSVGLTQSEFASLIGVSRVTLIRVETLEVPIKLETYFAAIREFKKLGVEIDATSDKDIILRMTPEGQQLVLDSWADPSKRRVDKK